MRVALLATVLLVSMGAKHRTTNFIVETADPRLAAQIGEAAERWRSELAVAWLGHMLPNWGQPCPLTVQMGPNLGAGGSTTFMFDHGEVFGWRMSIQGPQERIFDCVLPHEITHMIFASHFRQPLPRWADEGGATSVENTAELMNHRKKLQEFLRTNRGIAFNKLFAMRDYPPDVMPLYAQGYSLADFLIQNGGRPKYVNFVADGLKANDWSGAVQRNYGWKDLGVLQNTWLAWVRQGSPTLQQTAGPGDAPATALASASPPPAASRPRSVYDGSVMPVSHVAPQGMKNAGGTVVPVGSAVPINAPSVNGRFVPVGSASPAQLASAAGLKRPEPNLIYRERNATAQPPESRKLMPLGPPENEVAAAAYSLPPISNTAREMSGPVAQWRTPGGVASTVDAGDGLSSTQVTRPQPYQQPKQTILEWSRK